MCGNVCKEKFFFRNFCVGRKRKGANSNETEHSVETLPKATTRYMTQDMLYCLFVWLNSPLWCVIHTNMYKKNYLIHNKYMYHALNFRVRHLKYQHIQISPHVFSNPMKLFRAYSYSFIYASLLGKTLYIMR